jgi:hypothetical protein
MINYDSDKSIFLILHKNLYFIKTSCKSSHPGYPDSDNINPVNPDPEILLLI